MTVARSAVVKKATVTRKRRASGEKLAKKSLPPYVKVISAISDYAIVKFRGRNEASKGKTN